MEVAVLSNKISTPTEVRCKIYQHKSLLPKIPISDKNFFVIHPSSTWSYSVEIKVDTNEDVNLINLYLILKAYVLNTIVPCTVIAVAWKDSHDECIVLEHMLIYYLKRMSFYKFCEWYDWRIEEGLNQHYQQKRKDEVIYFIITLEKNILLLKNINLEFLKPEYPWDDIVVKNLINQEESSEYFHKKIELLKKENENLRTKLNEKDEGLQSLEKNWPWFI